MEQTEVAVPGNPISVMMDLQRGLIKHYQLIEGLPEYPVDLDSRQGQSIVKDFVDRFIEELSEAYGELEKANSLINQNQFPEAKQHAINYNVEIADCWHFLLETLIFIGLDEYGVENLLKSYTKDNGMNNFAKDNNPLSTMLTVGLFENTQDGINPISRRTAFILVDESEALHNPRMAGGRRINDEELNIHAVFCWQITHVFKTMSNKLKNRKWAQSDREVNKVEFYETLTIGLLLWGQYMNFAGFNQTSIYCSYEHKNKILQERIQNKY